MTPGYEIRLPVGDVPEGMRWDHTLQALHEVAQFLRSSWTRAASGGLLERATGSYVQGLRAEGSIRMGAGDSELSVGVFNVARHAAAIEEGHGGFHLPERVAWGKTPRSKMSKKGTWYFVVPLGHSAHASPSQQVRAGLTASTLKRMMPRQVYGQARKLTHYGLRGTKQDPGGPLRLSSRGGKRTLQVQGLPSRFEGMIRGGTKGHTQYLTFRTVSQNSRGWRIPARPGKHIARSVAEEARAVVLRRLGEALRADAQAALTGGGA